MPQYAYNAEKLPKPVTNSRFIELYNCAWKIAYDNIDYLEDHENWLPQMTCMPNVGTTWQWDSCFMTIFARYAGNENIPVMNNLDNLYRLQADDGFINMAYDIDSEKPLWGPRINPPLYAWVEWEYYKLTGDDSRFERVLPKLTSYYKWINKNRTSNSELYWFEDTGSSGMDNAPLSGYPSSAQNGSDVGFVDLLSQQALSAICLGKIADHLDKQSDVAYFEDEHAHLTELLQDFHWSVNHKFFYHVFCRATAKARHNYVNAKTVAGYWPLLADMATDEQCQAMAEHLEDPNEFNTPHPVPSLAKSHPDYCPLGEYWLGGVWPPTNYMIVKGLEQQGYRDLAQKIAIKHLNSMATVMEDEQYGGIWECYAPDEMRPADKNDEVDLVRPNFVGWGGLGPIALLIETVLGFDCDAPSNTVTWHITQTDRHGIQDLSFNGNTIDLIFDPATHTIETKAEKPFGLKVIQDDREKVFEPREGEAKLKFG